MTLDCRQRTELWLPPPGLPAGCCVKNQLHLSILPARLPLSSHVLCVCGPHPHPWRRQQPICAPEHPEVSKVRDKIGEASYRACPGSRNLSKPAPHFLRVVTILICVWCWCWWCMCVCACVWCMFDGDGGVVRVVQHVCWR